MAAFEVIALDTATPQLRAPGASDTYTFPRAVEMPLGTANGVLYLNGSKVVTSGSALTFDGTNLGLGTSSPTSIATYGIFTLNGSSGSAVYFQQGGATKGRLITTANELTLGTTVATNPIVFELNNAEQMRLTSAGLGIGTTSPKSNAGYATLTLNNAVNGGVLQFTQADTTIGQLFFDGNGGTLRSVSNDPLVFGTNNTERVQIKATGQLRFVPLAADPSGAEAGDVYYNSGTNKLRLYDGSTWVDLN